MSYTGTRYGLIRKRFNGRKPSNYPCDGVGIPLRITRLFPMKLKDVTIESLKESASKKNVVTCLPEMMSLFDCLEKHDFDKKACSECVAKLEDCHTSNNNKQTATKGHHKKS